MQLGNLTRRQVIKLGSSAAVVAAACVLGGCSNGSEYDEHTAQGFSSDTEIKDYDLTVYLIADEMLETGTTGSDVSRVQEMIEDYQAQTGRGNVTFAVKFMNSVDMAKSCEDGFEDACDCVIGFEATIELGVENEILYGGAGGSSVRNLSSVFSEKIVIVRAKGSSAEMPAASTLSGEDADDGSLTQMMNLGSFDGKIAIAAESLIEGVTTNKALARIGLYSESSGIGGEYDSSLKDKVLIFDSMDELAAALEGGTCGLGFMAQSELGATYTSLEKVYSPDYANAYYKGASVTDAEEGGVARDFLEYVSRKV